MTVGSHLYKTFMENNTYEDRLDYELGFDITLLTPQHTFLLSHTYHVLVKKVVLTHFLVFYLGNAT